MQIADSSPQRGMMANTSGEQVPLQWVSDHSFGTAVRAQRYGHSYRSPGARLTVPLLGDTP